MSDERICGMKLMQDWVPSGQSLFCNKPLGHDGQHAWRSEWQPLPTQQQQSAIDYAHIRKTNRRQAQAAAAKEQTVRVLRFVGAYLGILTSIVVGVFVLFYWVKWSFQKFDSGSVWWFLATPYGAMAIVGFVGLFAAIGKVAWDWSKR